MRTAKQATREQDTAHRETVAQALELAEQHRLAERYRNAVVDAAVARTDVERLIANGDESRTDAAREALAAIDAHIAWIRLVLRIKPAQPSRGYFYEPEAPPPWCRIEDLDGEVRAHLLDDAAHLWFWNEERQWHADRVGAYLQRNHPDKAHAIVCTMGGLESVYPLTYEKSTAA